MLTEEQIPVAGRGPTLSRPPTGDAPRNGQRARVRRSLRARWAFVQTTLESLRIAGGSLRANKLRTFLTLIGIVVGVAAVIAVVTIIKGLDKTVAQTFSAQGSTVFSVSKFPLVILSRESFVKYNRRKDMVVEDYEAVARGCTLCAGTGLAWNTQATVKHGDQKSEGVLVRGTTHSVLGFDNINVTAGREWTESEEAAGRDVCIVGPDVVDNLFGGAPGAQVVGQIIRIEGREYRVLGVPDRLGKIFGFSRDNYVYIPYPTYRKAFGPKTGRLVVFVQARSAELIEETEDQVRTIMRIRRGQLNNEAEDGFTIETQAVFLDLYSKATANIYLVTIGVAAVSLVVGGIVVMNIMLVSVTERTREIGIRKAVGARQRDILLQFLIEAMLLAATGGALGVLCGFGLAYGISALMAFPLLVSLWSAVLGVSVSSVVGIVSGIWPAWTAAQLDPIEALRAE
ncbi:MAG TPA: ABC transporter permease [Pyrinomonadaceae bacterium]|jgi:putative ABC transport system permease protein